MPRKPQGTKRRKRDPERPKRAMTAYMVYVRDNIKSVTRDMGNAKRSEVIRECGARWNRMTVTQKKKYVKISQEDKDRYAREMENYTPQTPVDEPKLKRKIAYTPKVAKAHQYFKFRKGKWADAETEYFELLVRLFAEGLLDVLFNYPLRMFLAHSMACDPMRISKKFVGNKQIGKQRYMPLSYADIDAYDKNKLKAIARKFNAVQDEFKKLLHQDIEAGPIDGVWISQDDILLRVLWPEVVRNEERRRK